MKSFWNWIKNDDDTRTLYLEGVLSEETWYGDEATPRIFKSELHAGTGDIVVWINSAGGDVFAAAPKRPGVPLDGLLKAFLDAKHTPDGLLSAEDAATYDKMEQDVVALGKEVDRLERQAALDRELAAPTSKPAVGQPGASPGADNKTGRASAEYRRGFWNVLRGQRDHAVLNSLKIGEDESGGYLVPEEYEKTLVTGLEEENIFRKLAHVIRKLKDSTGNYLWQQSVRVYDEKLYYKRRGSYSYWRGVGH